MQTEEIGQFLSFSYRCVSKYSMELYCTASYGIVQYSIPLQSIVLRYLSVSSSWYRVNAKADFPVEFLCIEFAAYNAYAARHSQLLRDNLVTRHGNVIPT